MILIAGLLLVVFLAVTPQSYRSPGGFQGEKVGVVESQVVDCGITLAPKNPLPTPPGSNEDCDAEHTQRGVIIALAIAATLLVFSIERLVRRRSQHLLARSTV
ncbi:MAG: hypothetical protein ACRDKG_11840 [Actinomycetota bacterium]